MGYQLTLREREKFIGWVLVLPTVVIILSLILYPVFYNVYLSFFRVSITGANRFLGWGNYGRILSDPLFWRSVGVTVLYVVLTTLGTTLVGLIVALTMNREFPLRWLVRSLILFPYVAPVVSVVFAWRFLFDPVNGIVMETLVEKLGWLTQRVDLIGTPSMAIWAAVIFSIWKNFPFTYLMILARLQGIDKNLYEAAEIDGANSWIKFRYITLPELYFVSSTLILLRIIWNFNKFEEVYLLTDNLKVLSVYTYLRTFIGRIELGEGAALTLIQFLLLIGFILFYIKKVIRW